MPKTPKSRKGRPLRGAGSSDVLSTGEVARACGVTRDGVLHWIHAGKLAAFRTPGGHFRVRRDDLAAFLRRSRRRYGSPPRPAAARILVVDDEPCIRDLLRDLLEDAGYRVQVAETTSGALETVADGPPDLVITDMLLPGGSGASLTRALRRDPALAAVPVIAVTGAFHDRRTEEISDAGADVLLAKPFRPEQLLGEVRRLLQACGMPGVRDDAAPDDEAQDDAGPEMAT